MLFDLQKHDAGFIVKLILIVIIKFNFKLTVLAGVESADDRSRFVSR
jgi:hypothetical protein